MEGGEKGALVHQLVHQKSRRATETLITESGGVQEEPAVLCTRTYWSDKRTVSSLVPHREKEGALERLMSRY